jgi:histidinol-phosphate aminotransferase
MAISRRRLLGATAAAVVAAPELASTVLGAPPAGSPQDTIRSGRMIRLHRNENRRGPSAKVVAAMRSAVEDAVRRYPDEESAALRRKIAKFHAIAPEHVVLGCGSGEILRTAIQKLAGSRRQIVAALPTFESVRDHARQAGVPVTGVPLRKDHSHDVTGMLAHTDAATGLVYVCNPNNPTGSLTRRPDLEALVRQLPSEVIVLIDEAYHDYLVTPTDSPSLVDYAVQDRKVIVTRTFSKMHALAGLRVGYAVASTEMARRLKSSALSDGVSLIAARAAAAALDDAQYVRLNAEWTADDRQEFLNQANARMLRSIDSSTNFVMLNTAVPAGPVAQHFANHRILVSHPVPGSESYIRVSMGTPAEMREFWRVWDLMPRRHHMAM